MKKLFTSLFLLASMAVPSSIFAQESVTIDFEDGVNHFTDRSRSTVSIVEEDGNHYQMIKCAGNAQNGYSLANLNLVDLFPDIDNAAKVNVKMKYWNTNGGRGILTLRDATLAGANGANTGVGKTAYGNKYGWFRLGSDKNNGLLQNTNKTLGDVTNKWLDLDITVDVENATVDYTVSADGAVLYTETAGQPYSVLAGADAPSKCSQIELWGYINNSEMIKVDDIVITVTQSTKARADYTIKFVDGNGVEIKDAITRDGIVGDPVELYSSEKADVVKDGQKYIYLSDNAEGATIAADGSSVVTVTYREAAVYNYSVTNNLNSDVITGSGFEGDVVYVPYPQYINKEGTLWKKADINQAYQLPVTLSADNTTATLEYAATDITDVVYYVEAEDIEGITVAAGTNVAGRCSNAAGGHTGGAKLAVWEMPAGLYKVTSQNRNCTPKFYLGDAEEPFFQQEGAGYITSATSEEITVAAPTTLYVVVEGDYNNNAMDWVYIQKTGEYEAPVPEMPEVFVQPEDGETIDGDLVETAMFALFFGDPTEFKYAAGCEDFSQIEITIDGEALEFDTDWTVDFYVEDDVMYPNGVLFKVEPESVKNGEMVVTIPAGAFTVYVWDADEEAIVDIVGTYDEEIVLHYTLENFPEQTVEPEPVETVEPVIVPSYTADTFEGIIIGFPGAEYANVNGALLYSDEITLRDATWSYYAESFDMTQDETTFFLIPNPTPNISGTYTLSLPEGLFTVDGAPSAETTVELTFEGFDPTVTFSVMPDGELEYEDFVSPENWNSTIGLMMSIEPGEVDVYAEEAENYLEKISVTMNGEALANGTDWTITRYEVDMSVDEEELILEAPNMFNIWINPEKIVDGEITVTIAEGAFNLHNFDMDYWEAYGDLGQSEAYSFTLTIINKPTDGISSVIANGVSTADVYTTSGVMVRKAGESLNGLAKGVYVTKGVKVLVK